MNASMIIIIIVIIIIIINIIIIISSIMSILNINNHYGVGDLQTVRRRQLLRAIEIYV